MSGKINARTLVLGADSREIGRPQYVVVGELIRIASGPKGPFD